MHGVVSLLLLWWRHTQVMPKDKQEVVAVLQKHGHIVGMTGDGVNDAPALKQVCVHVRALGM